MSHFFSYAQVTVTAERSRKMTRYVKNYLTFLHASWYLSFSYILQILGLRNHYRNHVFKSKKSYTSQGNYCRSFLVYDVSKINMITWKKRILHKIMIFFYIMIISYYVYSIKRY